MRDIAAHDLQFFYPVDVFFVQMLELYVQLFELILVFAILWVDDVKFIWRIASGIILQISSSETHLHFE